MSLNRTSFKGYNRDCDQPNIAYDIFLSDVYYDGRYWSDDDSWFYDDDYYDWENDLQCFRDRESDEEFYNKALIEFELELMRC